MSEVPVFGHAVQAPIVIAPNAVPRVSANCVRPSPKTAATAKANRNPISSRTSVPIVPESVAARTVDGRRDGVGSDDLGAASGLRVAPPRAPRGVHRALHPQKG